MGTHPAGAYRIGWRPRSLVREPICACREWRKLAISDPEIDELPSSQSFETLRRFRNAICHCHDDIDSDEYCRFSSDLAAVVLAKELGKAHLKFCSSTKPRLIRRSFTTGCFARGKTRIGTARASFCLCESLCGSGTPPPNASGYRQAQVRWRLLSHCSTLLSVCWGPRGSARCRRER